jgi:hypothetical protein
MSPKQIIAFPGARTGKIRHGIVATFLAMADRLGCISTVI